MTNDNWYARQIAHQIDVSRRVLNRVSHHFPDAVIAGGAPRNWYFTRAAKDIDVFISVQTQDLYRATEVLQETVGRMNRLSHYSGPTPSHPHLLLVHEGLIERTMFQFMFVSEPTAAVIETFPLSISKITYDGVAIRPTSDFMLGRQMKTIFRTGNGFGDREGYIRKIRNYFPDWTYSDKLPVLGWV